MTSRVRALFFASLAVVIGPFALPERASLPDVVAAPAVESAPVEHGAHPATYGARASLPNRAAEPLTDSPSAPAASAEYAQLPAMAAIITMAAPAVVVAGPLRLLPPSRAPPTLS